MFLQRPLNRRPGFVREWSFPVEKPGKVPAVHVGGMGYGQMLDVRLAHGLAKDGQTGEV